MGFLLERKEGRGGVHLDLYLESPSVSKNMFHTHTHLLLTTPTPGFTEKL